MDTVLDVVNLGRAARNTGNVKNRQPLSEMYVVAEGKELTEEQEKRLNIFVSIINSQVALCIDTTTIEVYYDSYLFVLLHIFHQLKF